MTVLRCDVCKQAEKKYKCPKCQTNYCSLTCYKEHQVKSCSEIEERISIQSVLPKKIWSNDNEVNREEEQISTEDQISQEKLDSLADNENIKRLLSNKHLRDYLTRLNSSHRPDRAIEAAMKEPLFLEFADECLKTVEGEGLRS